MFYTVLAIVTSVLGCLYALFWMKVHGYRKNCNSKVLLHGKTVVVTGGNSGIGKATAIDLALRGARVILACRNPKLAEDAVKDIQKLSKSANVVYYHLDLANLQSVRNFAEEYLIAEDRLDILINNAGIALGLSVKRSRRNTVDGFELNFGINYFGHVLLTFLLLDLLKQCSPSRIVMLSSDTHERVQSPLDLTPRSLDGSKYPGLDGYPISKLAIIMFARELASRLISTGVTVCSVHPGIVYSSIMAKEGNPLYNLFRPLYWLLFLSEQAGAQSVIHCAVDESIANYSGSYYENCRVERVRSWMARDDSMCKTLWDVSLEAVRMKHDFKT